MDLTPLDETYQGHQLYLGERGGKFFIDDNDKKRYIKPFMVKKVPRPPKYKKFNPKPRGAFYRSMINQQQL
jgi:hypothetical protein|tara:strand:+ start:1657 stop:1869 length:213 start_codon:yes stop_codon:yes gene_type:complete